jgi:hypothetical protein
MNTSQPGLSTQEVPTYPKGITSLQGLDPKKTYQLCCVCELLFEEDALNFDIETRTGFCNAKSCSKKFFAQSKAS